VTNVIAVVLMIAITAYAVFGGADFGAGFWDLVAGGAERGERPREVIDHSIGPVWEANHVWLIFIFVILWTGFPEAYASVTLTVFVPLTLAALGIVLRGSSFAFRKTVFRTRDRRNFGAAFALSSVLVPFCLGAVAGAVASGRIPAGGVAGDPWTSWLNPTSILGGVLAVVVVAYLAAVYLVWDARRLGDNQMVEYFRRRAVAAAVVAGVVAFVGIFVLRADARYVFDGLTSRALPLVIISAVCGVGSLVLLLRGAGRGARVLAMGALASVVVGWGVAQWPYILPTSLKVADAAAPSGTLTALLVATIAAVLIVLPGFIILYTLDQKSLLPAESVDWYAQSSHRGDDAWAASRHTQPRSIDRDRAQSKEQKGDPRRVRDRTGLLVDDVLLLVLYLVLVAHRRLRRHLPQSGSRWVGQGPVVDLRHRRAVFRRLRLPHRPRPQDE
jgi:cytochrome d ubiquinol oxidase subunit II